MTDVIFEATSGRPGTCLVKRGEWRAPNLPLSVLVLSATRLMVGLFVFLISCPLSSPLFAEIIQLKNGNSMETKILKEDDKFVTVQAPRGRVKIPKSDIQTIWRGSKEQLMEVRGREVYFTKGSELYQEGQFLAAAESFEQALGGSVLDTVIYSNLASAYASAGDRARAEANFVKALEKDTNHPDLILNAAHFYESTGDFQNAILYYRKYLLLKPDQWPAKKSLAYCYYQKKEYQKAAGIYELLATQKDIVSLYNAALCYLKLGNFNKAEAVSQDILGKKIPMARYFLLMAEIHKNKQMFREAESDYQHFLTQAKDDPEALLGLGFLYLEMKDDENAKRQFEKVLEKNPGNTLALNGLIQISMLRKDFAQATGLYEKMLETDQDNITILNRLGLVYLKMNEPQKALEIYRKIFTVNDHYARGHANAGLAYAFLGDADHALTEWDRALALDPSLEAAARNKKLLEDIMRGNKDVPKTSA